MPFGRPPDHFKHVPGNEQFVLQVYSGTSNPARNVKDDHRVTDPRAKKFIQRFNTDLPETLESQLDKHLNVSSGHEFHHRKWNRENLIHHRRGVKRDSQRFHHAPITATTKLMHVMRLDGKFLEILHNNAGETVDIKKMLDTNKLDPAHKLLIASSHSKYSDDRMQQRLKDNLSPRIQWATLADEFRPYVDQDARTWLNVLGLGHHFKFIQDVKSKKEVLSSYEQGLGVCFALFEYEVGYVSALARPSVLDAGGNLWHQVSDGDRPLEKGGRTKLVFESDHDQPVSEFIHSSVIFEAEHIQQVRLISI